MINQSQYDFALGLVSAAVISPLILLFFTKEAREFYTDAHAFLREKNLLLRRRGYRGKVKSTSKIYVIDMYDYELMSFALDVKRAYPVQENIKKFDVLFVKDDLERRAISMGFKTVRSGKIALQKVLDAGLNPFPQLN